MAEQGGEQDRFHDALVDHYQERDEDLRRRFDRSLAPEEHMSDRWERARRLGFASGASVYASALVYGDVEVGAETWVGPWVLLDGSGGALRIGASCSVSAGVQIYTHDTVAWALSGGERERRTAPVTVGDRCHIGSQSIIVAGVEIGTQCVIGANSLVNRSVPDRTIVAGSPARVIGHVVGDGAEVELSFELGDGST